MGAKDAEEKPRPAVRFMVLRTEQENFCQFKITEALLKCLSGTRGWLADKRPMGEETLSVTLSVTPTRIAL
jgi:hypothetical protein